MRLCVSDQHTGLKNAIARVLACPEQRFMVQFVREISCAAAPQRGIVSAAFREIFNSQRGS